MVCGLRYDAPVLLQIDSKMVRSLPRFIAAKRCASF